jgi:nucleotide-binding universal stress UspA family protein
MKIKPASNRGEVLVKLDRRDDNMLAESLNKAQTQGWPFQLKNILVPVDFSEASRRVLKYAVPLAEKFGAKITLVHVVEPRIYPESLVVPAELEQMNIRLMRNGREMLDALRRRAFDTAVASECIVALGKPYQKIVDTAREQNADLIIISTHGYTGLKHVLIGSTAERVVRYAACPVLTVREREEPAG